VHLYVGEMTRCTQPALYTPTLYERQGLSILPGAFLTREEYMRTVIENYAIAEVDLAMFAGALLSVFVGVVFGVEKYFVGFVVTVIALISVAYFEYAAVHGPDYRYFVANFCFFAFITCISYLMGRANAD
jgi:hypothetical protein